MSSRSCSLDEEKLRALADLLGNQPRVPSHPRAPGLIPGSDERLHTRSSPNGRAPSSRSRTSAQDVLGAGLALFSTTTLEQLADLERGGLDRWGIEMKGRSVTSRE